MSWVDRISGGVHQERDQCSACCSGLHRLPLAADPLELDRINVFEQWDSSDAVDAFRGSGPRRRTAGCNRECTRRAAPGRVHDIAHVAPASRSPRLIVVHRSVRPSAQATLPQQIGKRAVTHMGLTQAMLTRSSIT